MAVSEPLISVALPVRNGANFLAAALDSILAQTYADFVLHVSDNASDDATPTILADYARRDSRVQVSRSDSLIPQAANMNHAVGLAQSKWVKLFCHDDLMRPDCLETLVAAIRSVEGSAVALIGNGERHLFSNGYLAGTEVASLAPIKLSGKEAIARKLWDVSRAVPFPAVTTATVRKDAFDALGGFDARYLYFDLFAWLELLTRHDYVVVPDTLTVNRVHGAQVAVQARASLRELADFRAFLPEFLTRHGDWLGVSRTQALRVRAIPAALGARAVAAQLNSGRYGQAVATMRGMPVHYWLAMPLLVARAWLGERKRYGAFAAAVPRSDFYPG
jgi:glycosyltransferase involved in cell wall biosynthesis